MLRRLVRAALVTGLLVGLLAGCGEEEPKVIEVGARITTAADALECRRGAKVVAQEVKELPKASPDAASALDRWARRLRHTTDVPLEGYAVAVEEVGTVLFTHEDDRQADLAVVATRTEDRNGDRGWLVTSWARCKPLDPRA